MLGRVDLLKQTRMFWKAGEEAKGRSVPCSIVQSQHTNVIFLLKADLSSHPSTWEAEAHEELDKCPRERGQHDRLNRDPLASLHCNETPSSPCKPKDTCHLSPSQCSLLTTPRFSLAQQQGPVWCLQNIPAQGPHFSAPTLKPIPARSFTEAFLDLFKT